jgi:magnesium chelatase subunit I
MTLHAHRTGVAARDAGGSDAEVGAESSKPMAPAAVDTQFRLPTMPFSAIVGQDDMKSALMIAAVDPTVGGVLVMGDRGTGKSTAVRAMSGLLPPIEVVADCPYGCDPAGAVQCAECAHRDTRAKRRVRTAAVPMVDLPLGATEDRVLGSLDLERALADGVKAFQPGLLARANRGFLYVDEVNLLEDHIVDVLIDVAASGVNIFERDGISVQHPARFVLVGSGNPEEGELRPQLLDRFGLCVEVATPRDIASRVEIVRRRDAFERDPHAFCARWDEEDRRTRDQIVEARKGLGRIEAPTEMLEFAAKLCVALGTDGLRGELTLLRAARALASLCRRPSVETAHLRQAAHMALCHRLRRNPLDETGSHARIDRAVDEHIPS